LAKPNDIPFSFPTNFKMLDLSPGSHLEQMKAHSDIIDNQPLFDFLWGEIAKVP